MRTSSEISFGEAGNPHRSEVVEPTHKPSVSVVIPAYNTAHYLPEALDSVVFQRTPGFTVETILVDDGSTDATPQVAQAYHRQLRYFRIPHCGMPGLVRNFGLRHARGDYVAFLDSDDYLLPQSLALRLQALLAHPGAGFVYANFYSLDSGRLTLWYTHPEPPAGWIFDQLFLQQTFAPWTGAVLAHRSLVEECGGFHPALVNHEDYWLWLRLARRARAIYVHEPVSVYRRRAGTLSTADLPIKMTNLIAVVQAVARECSLPADLVHERVNPLRAWVGKECLSRGEYLRAVRWLLPVAFTEPSRLLHGLRRLAGSGSAGLEGPVLRSNPRAAAVEAKKDQCGILLPGPEASRKPTGHPHPGERTYKA